MSLIRQCRRVPVLLLPLIAAGLGCSTDDPVPECTNCESWEQVTPGLARFPDPDPADPRWVVYSTIEKRANAPDANRESDEDIWLTYHDGSGDIADTPSWQLTDDALGTGDNTAPRFSPTGAQIAFAHATGGGNFDVWRLPLTVPADPADPPLAGAPEIVAADARDPVWATETRLYFVRGDKIHRVDLPAGAGPPLSAPLPLTFNPPQFASNEVFIDRHPSFSPDGGAVFNSIGRRSVADVVMKAFEVDETVFPPDTTEARAWISYQPPTAQAPAYPLFLGADTLRTPRTLRSVPVDRGGTFTLGVRRDSRFLAPSQQSYCDTLITIPASLQPGDVDTLKYYFRVIRGTLVVASGIGQVGATWARQDQRESVNFTIAGPGGSRTFPCLMPFQVEAGQIQPGQQEPFLIRGSRVGPTGTLADSAQVVLSPGKTTTVTLFPPGKITGTVVFPGLSPPYPLAQVSAVLAGPGISFSANGDLQTGVFTVNNPPVGTYSVTITAPGTAFRDTTITGVVVTPPATTNLGNIVLSTAPNAAAAENARPAVAAPTPEEPEPLHVTSERERAGAGDNPVDLAALFRAEGDETVVWRLSEDAAGRPRLEVGELFGSEFLIQHPAVTDDLGNGLRYVAYTGNDTGDWQLYVQRLQDWVPDGDPVQVLTPGSSDNLSCVRTVFHPRWIHGRGVGDLALLVALGDCPSNGFEGLGIDDNPWAVGEIRVWKVELDPGF
jgi:hypothetical protein